MSNKVRTTPDLIKQYFVDFLKKEPKGTIIESYVINEDPILVFNGGPARLLPAGCRLPRPLLLHAAGRWRLLLAALLPWLARGWLSSRMPAAGTAAHRAPPAAAAAAAAAAGIYDFKLKGDDGTVSTVPARFTYVYEKVNGTYKILTHHSSVLPETARLVFYKWNDALQTKDPKKVVAMYDAKGVLVGGSARPGPA